MAVTGWQAELRRFFLVLIGALILGWLLGASFQILSLIALSIVAYWARQLRRVSRWLEDTESEPPEASGIWGELWDSIYHLQRKGREEKTRLQTEVSYLRDSFAAFREGAVMIDPDGRIEWTNISGQRLLGLQYPRDRGQALLNLLRIPKFHSYMAAADFSEPLYLDGPQDSSLRLLIEVTPFGRGSLLMLARDVTREERLGEMRRDFVANVSHELRTPLTVITGYLDTLIDNGLAESEKLERPLRQMQEQAGRMETLLKDLLWLSQLESAAEEQEEHVAINVGDLMEEIRDHVHNAYPDRELQLKVDSDAPLIGNYRQIYSAVSNLVMNALKYSNDTIELKWSERERGRVLSVADFGPGIESMHLPRLTERFYRVDKSRSVESGGTGLGLAIVKHVLAAHGGHLSVKSTVGKGSTFSCHFPLS